ncbi:MAG: hypothetical protein ACJ76V_12205 [Thermoleophilaceae bacterium]
MPTRQPAPSSRPELFQAELAERLPVLHRALRQMAGDLGSTRRELARLKRENAALRAQLR